MDSTDGNDTRLSDLHNTTIKTEDSDEDEPLVNVKLQKLNVIKKGEFFFKLFNLKTN